MSEPSVNELNSMLEQKIEIEIKSRDAAGNVTEHVRIHADGTEETIVGRQ